MNPVGVAVASFASMEAVSYGTHRWVMHGVGRRWHRSHHVPATGGLERNDLFPVCFSAMGFGAFAAAALVPAPTLFWVGVGVTAYGAAYLFVHEVYIHRRVPVPLPRWRYLEWLRRAHGAHHATSGEPYGMLVPVTRRRATRAPVRVVLDRSRRPAPVRAARTAELEASGEDRPALR